MSHSPNALHFQEWTNNIIYTHMYGSKKIKLFSKSLGISLQSVKVLTVNNCTLPCVYLFTLGHVKDERINEN